MNMQILCQALSYWRRAKNGGGLGRENGVLSLIPRPLPFLFRSSALTDSLAQATLSCFRYKLKHSD